MQRTEPLNEEETFCLVEISAFPSLPILFFSRVVLLILMFSFVCAFGALLCVIDTFKGFSFYFKMFRFVFSLNLIILIFRGG